MNIIDYFMNLPIWAQRGILAVIIIISGVIIMRLGVWILRKVLKKWLDAPLIYPTAKSAWKVIVWIYAISLFMQFVINVSPATMLTTIGISGLTIGVAMQGLFKDLANGFLILALRHFVVGDIISAKGICGRVTKITLTTTVLEDEGSGEMHYIANSELGIVTKKMG